MTIELNPVYNQFFPEHGPLPNDWEPFKSYVAAREDFSTPDFAIHSEKSWQETAKTIALTLLKTVIFPWGLYELAKAAIDRLAMIIAYPAQFTFPPERVQALRTNIEMALQNPGNADFVGREVVLEKDGHRYTGLLLGHKRFISNGKWVLMAPGNNTTIEAQFNDGLSPFLEAGYNVLLVNGPGIGKNSGLATVDKLGDAQDVAISFLESALKAQRIVLAGHSLGGAAIGLAVMKHNFKPDVHYLAIRLMTFDRMSHLVEILQGPFVSKLLRFFGCEMDSIAASKKLQEKGIHEVIMQAEHDEIMSRAGLLEGLKTENLMENKTGIILPGATHCDLPAEQITQELQKWDRALDPGMAV